MPVYDLSYRHWKGALTSRSRRWIPIAWTSLGPQLQKRAFILWLVLVWMPAVVCGVLIYVRVNLGQNIDLNGQPLLDADASFFRQFYQMQWFMHLLTAVFVGAGLVANDRRTNALQIYLSKPIRPIDYLMGKGAAVAACLGIVTLGPAAALYLFRVGLDRDGTYWRSHLAVPFSILAGAALIVFTLVVITLTVSSLARSGRTAGVVLVMLYMFLEAARGMLGALFGRSLTSLLSPAANLTQGLDLVFGLSPTYGIHPMWSLLALGAMLAVGGRVLLRRVRPVEVSA